MTSNIGTRELTEFGSSVGFSQKSKEEQYNEYSKAVVEKALKKAFAPEFLNRIDDLIQFNALNKENIYKIIDIELQELFARIRDLNITLSLSQAAREFIVEKGYDQKFGARPLKRAIQKYVEDPMAEFMLNNSLKGNTNVLIDYVNEKITVSKITKKRKSKQT